MQSKIKILYSGRSMTEMLGVLAIMGIITAVSMESYNTAISTVKTNRTVEDLTKIGLAVHANYKNSKYVTYEDISMLSLISNNTIPAFPGSKNAGINQYGGKYTLEAGENNSSFFIVVTNVPKRDCIMFTERHRPGIESIEIDGSRWYPSHRPTAPELTSKCTDGETSIIKFEYK
ncbi:MAG: hypothetical protein LBU68_00065 [Rickettsiales bacterium]|nr:hypothetical protein [Rickettsiales bacterium]